MARVEIATQGWGWVVLNGAPVAGAVVQIKNTSGSNATHWSALTGGTSSTGTIATDSQGAIRRFIDSGKYDIVVNSVASGRVEAMAASDVAVIREEPLNVAEARFGAVFDGSTDDTAAINAATAMAAATTSTNGGEVRLPRGLGKYTTLLYSPRVTLAGAGIDATQLIQISGTAAPMARSADTGNEARKIAWRDFTLTAIGNSSNQGGLHLYRTYHSDIDRVKISWYKSFGVKIEGGAVATSGDSMRNTFTGVQLVNSDIAVPAYWLANGPAGGSHPDGTRMIGGIVEGACSAAVQIDVPAINDPLALAADCFTAIGWQTQQVDRICNVEGGQYHRFIGCRFENTAAVMTVTAGEGTASSPVDDICFSHCMFIGGGLLLTVNNNTREAIWFEGCTEGQFKVRNVFRDHIGFQQLTTPYQNRSLWMSTDKQLRWYDHVGGSAFVDVGKIRAVSTTPYTQEASDRFITVDATGGARVVDLTTSVGQAGKRLAIKKIDSSANTVTVDASGAQTIDGATTKVLTAQWETLRLISDGTNWLTT